MRAGWLGLIGPWSQNVGSQSMTEPCSSSVTNSVRTTDFVTLTVTLFVVGAQIHGLSRSSFPVSKNFDSYS